MNRTALTAFVLAICCLAALPAEARKKAKPDAPKPEAEAEAKPDTSGKPAKVATFGDWGAFLAKGKGKAKTCYTLAAPSERMPKVKRAPAYVFIADRPAEKVRNEVSIIMGFTVKDGAPAQAKVGKASFDLVAKGANAWIKDPADEAKFVESLKHAGKLVVKAAPTRGPATTDTYVLGGFKQALDRVTKDCK